jgi:hypothetical protein
VEEERKGEEVFRFIDEILFSQLSVTLDAGTDNEFNAVFFCGTMGPYYSGESVEIGDCKRLVTEFCRLLYEFAGMACTSQKGKITCRL